MEALEDRIKDAPKKPKKRLKWTKRFLAVAVLVAAGVAGADWYLAGKYTHRAEKAVAEKGIEALFKGEAEASAFFTKEYLDSLGPELWEEMKKYELLEFKALRAERAGPDMILVHYRTTYRNRETGTIEENRGILEITAQGGKYLISGE